MIPETGQLYSAREANPRISMLLFVVAAGLSNFRAFLGVKQAGQPDRTAVPRKGGDMRVLIAIGLSTAICFCTPGFARTQTLRVQIKNTEALAGPWEFADQSGVHGVFIEIRTFSEGPASQQAIKNQEFEIQVYHRYLGKTREGWFTNLNGKPETSSTNFDGSHLRIHFTHTTELGPFDLSLTFHPVERKWTGTWRWSGRTRDVVLTRPRATLGMVQRPLCGDWKGQPNPTDHFPFTPGSLHIRESADGAITAWLDRRMSAFDRSTQSEHVDERDGELLRETSMEKDAVVLEMVSAMAPIFRYSGKLSFQHLQGSWGTDAGEGLQAPNLFIRVP